ncbi:hypothetical protein L0337_27355 [candidate division KSB1 bacterium]|nr:hypothetical protein [candidate division KSB1 bacterium]
MVNKHEQRLAYAAQKAATRETYIAYYLAQYQQQEALTEKELQNFVGCTGEAYSRLALCRVPDLQANDFRQRIERITSFTSASALNLAQVIRQVAAVQLLQKAPESTRLGRSANAMLLAARDREKEKDKLDHENKPQDP